jgi:hypothetical protein
MAYSTTNLNEIVKETYDAVIQDSFDNNVGTLNLIKREVPTEGLTALGRVFTINLQDNESYGSTTEGGAFPAAGAMVDDRATVNYRSQFSSFDFTGDVQDLATNKTLQNATTRIIKNTTEAFDAKQDLFCYGTGNGVIAQIDTVSVNDITALNNVTYGYGARNVRKGQRLNAYDVSGTAYRVGDMVVASVNRSTDVIAVDTAAAAIATDDDDVLVFEDSYNLATQGFAYHVNNSSTTWLGLTRSSTPGIDSIVYDASSASIDYDLLENALVLSRNIRGDAAPKFDYTVIGHPVQHSNLRKLARSSGNVQFNAQMGGNEKIDLMVKDVALAGMKYHEASNCSPSDMWMLKLSDWAIEEVAPRQLYKHGDGQIFIQKLASGPVYADAKEGRVYWRYNLVCKAPFRQVRIKNLMFDTALTRIKRA